MVAERRHPIGLTLYKLGEDQRELVVEVLSIEMFVSWQETSWEMQSVFTEWRSKLGAVDTSFDNNWLGHGDFESFFEGWLDVFNLIEVEAFSAHYASEFSPRWSLDVAADKTVVVEVNLVLLFCAPCVVTEYNSQNREIFLNSSHDFVEGHTPSTVTSEGHYVMIWAAELSTECSLESETSVTVGQACNVETWSIELQVAVSGRRNVTDIGGYDAIFRFNFAHFEEQTTWMDGAFFRFFHSEFFDFSFPSVSLSFDVSHASFVNWTIASFFQQSEETFSGNASVAYDTNFNWMGTCDLVSVNVDLNDLLGTILQEVLDVVLWQGTEVGQTATDSDDYVSFLDAVHSSLGTHVTDRPYPMWVAVTESVVVEVRSSNWAAEVFSDFSNYVYSVGVNNATAVDDNRLLSSEDNFSSLLQGFCIWNQTRGRTILFWREDEVVNFAIEVVTWNIEVNRTTFCIHGAECGTYAVSSTAWMRDLESLLGDRLEDRNLIYFLETVPTNRSGTSGRTDDQHWAVSLISGSNGSNEVGDTRAVLTGADTNFTGYTVVSVHHVASGVFVAASDETNAGSWE